MNVAAFYFARGDSCDGIRAIFLVAGVRQENFFRRRSATAFVIFS